jgi:rubredoxin
VALLSGMFETTAVLCPVCAIYNQQVAMVEEKQDFWRCPDCDAELWPTKKTERKYKSIWGRTGGKLKGGSKSKGGRYKNKKKMPLIPWYQRERE